MTDTLSTRPTMEAVTALMEPTEHPIRRADTRGSVAADDVSADPAATPVEASPVDATPSDEAPTGSTPTVFPAPPERGSLDDEHLVPLVGRHTTDTATIDLIGILQAQMHLRAEEAARFAAWEEQMRLIGTDEALGEVERTRLHFTGVIPVQTSPTVVTAGAAPSGSTIVPERIRCDDQADSAAPSIVTVSSVPVSSEPGENQNPHLQRAREADELLLEQTDAQGAAARGAAARGAAARGDRSSQSVSSLLRTPMAALGAITALVVVAAVILLALQVLAPLPIVPVVVAVLAAAWVVLLVALRRPARAAQGRLPEA